MTRRARRPRTPRRPRSWTRSRSGKRSRRRRLPERLTDDRPEGSGEPAGEDALALALKALAHKERTESELAEWLRGRGVDEAELAEALARLAEAGAIDDERFARRFAEDKRELRGWGPDRIAEALRGRGVEEGLIDAALAAEDDEEVAERALEVLERSEAEVSDDASRARALSLLARRGYPLEVAYEAVRMLERRSRAA